MKTIKIKPDALVHMLEELARETATLDDTSHAGNGICCALAYLIATQPYGSVEQQNLMDIVLNAGFVPEYYGGGVRVGITTSLANKD